MRRWIVLLLTLLLSDGPPAHAEKAAEIRQLANLFSPTPLKELDDAAFRARLYVILAHLEQTRIKQGIHAEELIERALALKNFSTPRSALIRTTLVDAYRKASSWQLFREDQLARLAKGEPATIQFGRWKGQPCRADYIVPPADVPGFKRELANLWLTTEGEPPDAPAVRRVSDQLTANLADEKAQRSETRRESKERSEAAEEEWDAAMKAAAGSEGVEAVVSLEAQSLATTSRENRQRTQLSIRATNGSRVPAAVTVEWFFIARSPEKGGKFLAGEGARALRLVPSAATSWEVFSDSFTSGDVKRAALALDGEKIPRKASKLRKIDEIPLHGWIVRAVREKRVIAVKTSTSDLEKMARDETVIAEMRAAADVKR